MDKELLDWIEDFYAELERDLYNYTRPDDYIERALRVLNGKRKPYREKGDGNGRIWS